MNLHGKCRGLVWALMILMGAIGIWTGTKSLAARQQEGLKILKGAEAIDQLEREGHSQTLQAAMQQAQLAVSMATQTPLGRAAWHAPNWSAGYDAYVTENGVSIAVGNQAYVSLSLQKLGYGTALRAIAPGNVSGEKQSIQIERQGGLREWFFNGPDGLEHGFTLNNPPGARQPGVPLRLALQLNEGWRATASEDGQRVTLRGTNGHAVEYGKLTVNDKTGRPIPARLTADNENVVIEVEDHNAEYPLTIDPLFTLQQRLLATDGAASEYFGYAVALSGNTAVIGAPYDENSRGSAYVFVRNGGTWTQQARLLASDGALNDYFGWSVDLDGNTALIGTLYGPGNINPDQGAAYVFVRNGTTWTQQQRLAASDGQLGAHFGTAVSLDNNTALIGAPDHQLQPGLTTGAAYAFVRTGTTWTQQKQLLAIIGESGDQFGAAVAVDGDMALIGAPGDDVFSGGTTKVDQGSAYTFRRSGTDWIRGNPLDSRFNGGGAGDAFGNAVALSGNTALIGSYLSGSLDVGYVYVYKQIAPGAWNYETILPLFDNQIRHIGVSLALDGDIAVVGASLKLFEPGTDSRSAWVFAKVDNTWREVRKFGPELGSSPSTVDDRFGAAVAIDDSTVLIGAYQSDAIATNQGAAYVFSLHDSQHVQGPKLTANDGAANDHFGKAMASSGDTLVISADEDDIGTNTNQGSVYVFMRNGVNWVFQQKLTANDGAAQDRFGNAVALDGDTLVVGAAMDDINGNTDQGSAYIFTRNGTTWTFQQKLIAAGIDGLPGDNLGASVSVSGQTVAVGASGENQGRGAAYVFTRTGTTWSEQTKLFIGGSIPPISFGVAVALYGNGDRLLVGAPLDGNGQGAIYPYLRSGAAWFPRTKVIPFNPVPGAHFGSAIGLAQDIYQVFVGAPDETVETNPRQGAVYVYSSGAAELTASGYFTAIDGAAEDNFGSAIAMGNNIAVVGAPGDNIGAITDQGSAHVYNYLGGFWHWQRKLIASDGATSDGFGSAVAVSANAVIVGSPGDVIGTNAGQGSAYVFASPVCSALTIAPSSLPNGSVGTMYNQVFTTSGASIGDYQYTLTDGVLPPGLFFESFGILHGTPTTAGTYRFTIKSTFESNLCAASRSYTVTILPPCLGMAINPATLPDSTVGTTYNQTMTATGEAPPYTFMISAGNLPTGLSLAANGALTGAPTAVGTYTFSVQASNAGGCSATQAYTVTIHQSGGGLQFYPLAHPVRLLDTRVGASGCDAPGAKIAGGTSRTQTAAGSTCDGLTIPANATALVGNATSVQSGGGYFTLYPSDIAKPNSANSNYAANQILNSLFTVRLGASDGAFKIFASTDTDIVVDITGYYAPPSATGLYFHPLPKPVRLLDTRAGASACFTPGAALQGNTDTSQIGTTTCDGVLIPAGALALTGNATTVSPQANGFLTLYPSNAARPLIASANFQPGVNLNSPFMVGLSPSGQFNLYVASTTDLVIDVTGYYSTQMNDSNGQGLLFKALTGPTRLLDTRAGQAGCFTPDAQMTGGTAYLQSATGACTGIPATAQAVVGNATTLNAVANGYLTFWPSGANQPFIATSNYRTGITFNRHFTTGLGADGAFKCFALSTTDLAIDLCGYFAP